jgi:hypothetical protein
MAGNRALRVNVRIQQSANHALVLRLVLCCIGLEKLDAALAQCQRDFHAVFPKRQFGGGRQKIRLPSTSRIGSFVQTIFLFINNLSRHATPTGTASALLLSQQSVPALRQLV